MRVFASILSRYGALKASPSAMPIKVSSACAKELDTVASRAQNNPQDKVRPSASDFICDVQLAARAVLTPEQYRFFRVYHLEQLESQYRYTVEYRLTDAQIVRLLEAEFKHRGIYPHEKYFNQPVPVSASEMTATEVQRHGRFLEELLYTTATIRILESQYDFLQAQTAPQSSFLLPRTVSAVIEDIMRPVMLRDRGFFKRSHATPKGNLAQIKVKIRTDYLEFLDSFGIGRAPALRAILNEFECIQLPAVYNSQPVFMRVQGISTISS